MMAQHGSGSPYFDAHAKVVRFRECEVTHLSPSSSKAELRKSLISSDVTDLADRDPSERGALQIGPNGV